MTIKIDPMFDTMAQVINKIQRDIGNTVPNPDPYHRVDVEFSPLRQVEARVAERLNINLPRIAPLIPAPREELMVHDPPMFRKRPSLEPINFKDPMNHPHTVPELPKATQPCFVPNIFEKKKEPWELF